MEALCEREVDQSTTTTTIQAPVHRELLVMDWNKKSTMRWDGNDPAQEAAARAKFAVLRGAGFLAYKMNVSGTQGEVIDSFDKEAPRTIMHAPLVGG
jgi:hypothetical protein